MSELTRRRVLLLAATTTSAATVPLVIAPAKAAPTQAAATAALAWNADWAAAAYTANPGAATSSGSENAGLTPGYAFDGNASTRWSSNFADNAWIAIDLGTTIRVSSVVLAWEAAYGLQYALEISADGQSWKPFFTENAGTGGAITAYTFPQEAVGRYVRMRGIKRATQWGYSLYSFEVYGGVPAPAASTVANLSQFHPAYGDYYQDAGHTPADAFDGGIPASLTGDITRWASDWNTSRWVGADLGATSRITQIDLYWESAFAVDYRIQVSADNTNWSTVYQPSAAQVAARRANIGTPGSSTGLHDTIPLASPVSGRYVRMLGVERRSFYNPAPSTAQFGYSLYEFQVWGTGGTASAAYPAAPTAPTGTYRTVFFDDFTGTSLDRSKWRVVITGSTMGSVNGEAQAYIDSAQALSVSGSQLLITPQYKPSGYVAPNGGTYFFTSGRIDTSNSLNFTHGRVSARIKMTAGLGFWPAFWLLGSNVNDPYVSWPDCGEADIMENIGYASWTSSSLHGPGYSGAGNIGTIENFPAGQAIDGWHVYEVEWTPLAMRFSLDGTQYLELLREKIESTRGAWVYDSNQYVILNFALGGAYPAGWNGVTSPFWGLPQSSVNQIAAGGVTLAVDWVLVEQFS
jgi:beta-glucanase (GH16 family)